MGKRRSNRNEEYGMNATSSVLRSMLRLDESATNRLFPEVTAYKIDVPVELKEGEYERELDVDSSKDYYGRHFYIYNRLNKETRKRIARELDSLARHVREKVEKVYEGFPECYIFATNLDQDNTMIRVINPDWSFLSIGISNRRSDFPPDMEVEYEGKMVKPANFNAGHKGIESPHFNVTFSFRLIHQKRLSKILNILDSYVPLQIYALNRNKLKKILSELDEKERAEKVKDMLERAKGMQQYSDLKDWISAELPDTAKALAREMV